MGKKGGSETTSTTVKLPKEIEDAAKQNIKVADQIAALGAMPYRGTAVAGFSPQQLRGMQGQDQAASAFGMPSALGAGGGQGMSHKDMFTALTGMPPPNSNTGGFQGYSTAPIFDQAYAQLSPGQRNMIESFLINPNTGAAPTNPVLQGMQVPQLDPSQGRTTAERQAILLANQRQQQLQQQQAAAQQARQPQYTAYNTMRSRQEAEAARQARSSNWNK